MSLLEQYREAVRAQPLPGLAAIASAAARDFGTGTLTWDELAEVNDLIQARRERAKAAPEPKPPRVHQGATPRTPESIERRRNWFKDPRLPREYGERFTVSQGAAIVVILKECVEKGACRLTLGAIAGVAGTCKTVVREAVRKAIEMGLVESKHHRRSYHRSDPNTIRVVSAELKDWLRIGVEMAKRAAGVATRTKAQTGKVWHQRKADDRRAAQTLRRERLQSLKGEAAAESLRGAAERRASAHPADASAGNPRARYATEMLDKLRAAEKGGGSRFASATQEPFLQKESPEAATQLQDENCPNGSLISGGDLFAVARRAARKLGLDPSPYEGEPENTFDGVTIEGLSVRWT